MTVYEKENFLGERVHEWTMLIHWALPIIQKLLPEEVLDDLRSAYSNPFYPYDKEKETLSYFNGVTGEVAFNHEAAVRRVSRSRFRAVLAKGLDIRWGTAIADLKIPDGDESAPVTICFANGTEATANVVFGADGGNSTVRRWLLGENGSEPERSLAAIGSGIVTYESAEVAKSIMRTHPICAIAPLPNGVAFTASEPICTMPLGSLQGLSLTTFPSSSPKRPQPRRPLHLVLPHRLHVARSRS